MYNLLAVARMFPDETIEPTGPPPRSASPASGWLAGLLLGAITGLTSISFVLGVLAPALLAVSTVLILWKGPRLLGAAGYLTGFGLAWTVLIANSTISCLTVDRGPGRWCEPGDGVLGFLIAGGVLFVAGLAGSAFSLRHELRRSRRHWTGGRWTRRS